MARGSTAVSGLLQWWNDGFSVPVLSPLERRVRRAAVRDAQICDGVRRVEDVAGRDAAERCGPAGTVHFAAGRCVVSLILPEGPGSLWFPSTADRVRSELIRALGWWALKSGNRLSFVLVDQGIVGTSVEPGALPIAEEERYIGDCLLNLGYGAGSSCPFTMLAELNDYERDRHGANWAYTQFVLNADAFPGSAALAYAYLGGPHTVALQGNGSLSLDELDHVISHEMGHIFQAADEYASACSGCSGGLYGYLNTPNGNCISCPSQEGRCVMRGASEYSLQEMHSLETAVNPCSFTRRMAGLWDGNGNGILDVQETYPETEILTAVPDTVDTPTGFRIEGVAWDTPYPAPSRYPDPVTINRIRAVEFRIDGGVDVGQGRGIDGLLTDQEEEFELSLPPLGGGPHFVTVPGVNTAGIADPTASRIDFFVYDVLLRQEVEVNQEGTAFAITWRVDGEDFGSRYLVFRRLGVDGEESLLGTVDSRGGRNDRFVFWDRELTAGANYLYRLEVDIPGKGRKELGFARGSVVLAPPGPGKIVTIAPNPSRGATLMSVTVPRGPRPDRPDVLFPGIGSPGFRDEDDSGGSPGESGNELLWRDVTLRVFDVRGRLVRDLGRFRQRETLRFNVDWDGTYTDGSTAPTGVYFVRITLDYQESIEKLVLVR
jgi:hypothetical protein